MILRTILQTRACIVTESRAKKEQRFRGKVGSTSRVGHNSLRCALAAIGARNPPPLSLPTKS